MLVSGPVERSDLLRCETPGLGKDGVGNVLGKIAEQAGVERGLQPGDMLQREGDLVDWRAIHDVSPLRCREV